MAEETFYQFPRFLEHRTRSPIPPRAVATRRATVSNFAKVQGDRSRRNVSELTRSLSQKTKAEPTVWLPGVPMAEGEFTPPSSSSDSAAAQLKRYEGPRAAEFLPSKTDAYIDMTPIRSGSFLYMSKKHVEEDDYFSFDEQHQTATF
ncbi:hypothetical protein Hte_001768 [Hypoxylon texense]